MKLMPNIKLTSSEVEKLKNKCIDYGGESYIATGRRGTLYKIFKSTEDAEETKKINENKFQKILKLYNIHKLNYSIMPLSTISLNGEFIGYEMTHDKGDETFFASVISKKEKIEYLKKVKDALIYFESKNIIYGDIKCDNILLNQRTHQIKFCDIDNIQLENYKMDIIDDDYSHFVDEDGFISKNVHPYMCNLFTMEEMESSSLYHREIVEKLQAGYVPDYLTDEATPTLKKMISSYNGYNKYLVDYLKK